MSTYFSKNCQYNTQQNPSGPSRLAPREQRVGQVSQSQQSLFKTGFTSALGKNLKLGFFPSSCEAVGENERTVLGPTETATLSHSQFKRKLTTSLVWSNNTALRDNTHHTLKIVNGNETVILDASLQIV